MYGYIYKATRKADGKIYIGQHKGEFNLIYHGKGKNVRNTPAEDFDVELIIETTDIKDSREKEKYYIEYYNSRNPEIGLNIKRGGGGGTPRKLSDEEKEQFKTRMKNLLENGMREQISERMKKNNPSKQKDMSGKNNPHYGHSNKGKIHHTEESKRKLSEAHTGLKTYNNGINTKMFRTEEEALSQGYLNRGKIK